MVNYSKAIIYKLCCKDPEITDIYVGSTCDKYTRKSHHKGNVTNPNNERPVYKYIRKHGGFDNWNFVPIEVYPCESKTELVIRERYWFEKLGASLNSCYPQRSYKEWYQASKEKVAEKTKKYREKHKEKIRKFKSNKEVCECGETFTHCHKARHERTDKHLLFIGKVLNKYKCPCGSTIQNIKAKVSIHKTSQKHMTWEQQPEPNIIFVD